MDLNQKKEQRILNVVNLKNSDNDQEMSLEGSKKNSFRQPIANRSQIGFKIGKTDKEKDLSNFRKLPFVHQRKYFSSKNLVISSTCQTTSVLHDFKQNQIAKIKKKSHKTIQGKSIDLDKDLDQIKYFFKKRKQVIKPLEFGDLKKYSSYNKLTSFPSIPQILISNDDLPTHNQNAEPQRSIKSSNSIKLQAIPNAKKPKLERFSLRKILKSQMSKTINPRKNVENEHSIELQLEQKNVPIKKRSKLSKDAFDRIDSKTKILVKNPFNRFSKKHEQIEQKLETKEKKLQTLERQLKLSQIFEDTNNESEMSMSGKYDLQNLIGCMNK